MAKKKTMRQMVLADTKEQELAANAATDEWYRLDSLLGYTWAMYFVIAGGREIGKSFAASEFLIRQWRQKHRRFFWIRLSEASKDKLLKNNCDKMFNNLLRRKYKLDTCRVGDDVYEVLERDEHGKVVKKAKMGTVMALSEMAKDKGVEYFDAGYKGWINIVVDELVRERRERNTFDITYNLANQLENIVRSRKEKVRILLICNMCSDVADVLPSINFIPVEYGRYKLKSKKMVFDYLPVTEAYRKRRDGAAANILLGMEDGNFNNEIARDTATLYQGKLRKPTAIIKFSVDKRDWFTLWDNRVIRKYKGEKIKNVIAMRRHVAEVFEPERRDVILSKYDARGLFYADLVSQALFVKMIKEIKSN